MKKMIGMGILFIFLSIFNMGCSLIGPVLGAGAAYGIYLATKK